MPRKSVGLIVVLIAEAGAGVPELELIDGASSCRGCGRAGQ
jgi:hypothetical protein